MNKQTCSLCFGTDFLMDFDGHLDVCRTHQPHKTNAATRTFSTALERLINNKQTINPTLFRLAQFLTLFDTEHPCPRSTIETQFCQMDVPSRNERQVKKWIEQLRREWLLPIGSHKALGGYYFITDPDDFIRWQRENIAPALTAIQTNYRVFKHNFRGMAGQAKLDFRVHLEDDLRAVLEAA